jgi:hypothetical protein
MDFNYTPPLLLLYGCTLFVPLPSLHQSIISKMALPVVRRLDYKPNPVSAPNIALNFLLDVDEENGKRVVHLESSTTMAWAAGPVAAGEATDLVLHAELTVLLEPPTLNGAALSSPEQYVLDAEAETLTIKACALPPPSTSANTFVLRTVSKLMPEDNLQLQG